MYWTQHGLRATIKIEKGFCRKGCVGMKMFAGLQPTEMPPIARVEVGVLLACVGGFLDAYTYQCRGGVLANAQTGNLVRLGMALPQGNWSVVQLSLCSVLAFIAGVMTSEAARTRFFEGRLGWQGWVLAIEMAAMLAVGCVPASPQTHTWVNLVVSYVAAMQANSFRTLVQGAFCTTMCTGNLRSASVAAWQLVAAGNREEGKNSLRYVCVILSFCLGAGLGVVMTGWLQEQAIWLCCLPMGGLLMWLACKRQQSLHSPVATD